MHRMPGLYVLIFAGNLIMDVTCIGMASSFVTFEFKSLS